ncbi:hypothetical protein HGRIS_001353 [Hohenbuehelia grisea]|uniref:Uncharacterized protein n=1 Tax=Hohenbuehelia grisea TaxID=104357 RepID=A0ABR3JQC9_9AGAR
MIRENLEWTTPSSIVPKVQAAHPHITPKQIHKTWTAMSETLWKRYKDQLVSAKLLLEELGDDVEIFDVEIAQGISSYVGG